MTGPLTAIAGCGVHEVIQQTVEGLPDAPLSKDSLGYEAGSRISAIRSRRAGALLRR